MSSIGKNIKKIRSVKGLSQQAFAEIFNLKRATLGAYEEERSEPKIETVIKIANYFSISIDHLLTKELTVNSLVQFKDEFTTATLSKTKNIFPNIPCITTNYTEQYPEKAKDSKFIQTLPQLSLPINPDKKFRGFEVNNLEMTNHDKGFYPKDVVVGEFVPKAVIPKLNNGTLIFCVYERQIIFRRLYIIKDTLVLRADHKNIKDIEINLSKISELWRVRYVFCRRIPEFSNQLEDQLVLIQHEISQLKNQLRK